MKKFVRLFSGLLIFLHLSTLAIPMPADAASVNYGVILNDSKGIYHLYNNLIVISPAGNLMIKAESLCDKLGLKYTYNKASKELLIKNPVNGKFLIYTIGSDKFTYFSSDRAKGKIKSATYKAYYDKKSKSNLIHIGSLQNILSYKYYKDLKGSYYDEMRYKAIAVYNTNGYPIDELPITDRLTDYLNSKTYTDKDELLDAIRINLINRNTKITLNTIREVVESLPSSNTVYSLVTDIDKPNTAKDGDYLARHITGFSQRMTIESKEIREANGTKTEIKSGSDPAKLIIDVAYKTSLEQEVVVDATIAKIIRELKLDSASDYQKVKLIHDYIINNSSYDISMKNTSAYNLLVDKTAVCEGYALAAYRLFLAAGLENRIIYGMGKDQPHAWNIVKVDGEWYNIDITWDDPLSNSGKQLLKYDYFLKSDSDFTDHTRSLKFKTAQFYKSYPMAKTSYPLSN